MLNAEFVILDSTWNYYKNIEKVLKTLILIVMDIIITVEVLGE